MVTEVDCDGDAEGLDFRIDDAMAAIMLKGDTNVESVRATEVPASEVQSKTIFMGHQISSCHVLVVMSFFILWKMLLSS